MRTFSVLAVLLCLSFVAVAADKPEGSLTKENWDTSYLEKQWNLTLKSVRCTGKGVGSGSNYTEFELVLEFAKDTSDVQPLVRFLKGIDDGTPCPFRLDLIDSKKVSIAATTRFNLSAGEVSGKQGDAFRVKVSLPTEIAIGAAKAQIRPSERVPKSSGTSK
jgi:hypothetical protein